MRRSFLFPLILLVGAVGLFFGFAEPTYQTAQALEERNQRLDEALTRASELQAARDALLSKFNTMADSDLVRLEKLLPNSIDSVRLVLDVDTRARAHNIIAKDFQLQNVVRTITTATPMEVVEQPKYGTVDLSFSAQGTYNNFLLFLRDLEQSLRLVDLMSLELTSSTAEAASASPRNMTHTYVVRIRTYWLR